MQDDILQSIMGYGPILVHHLNIKDPLEKIRRGEERVESVLPPFLKQVFEDHLNIDDNLSILAVHYQGIQVLSQKKYSIRANKQVVKSISRQMQVTDTNLSSYALEFLLRVYEAMQGHNAYTLNSFINALVKKTSAKKLVFESSYIEDDQVEKLLTVRSYPLRKNMPKRINVCISRKFTEELLGDLDCLLSSICKIISRNEKLCCETMKLFKKRHGLLDSYHKENKKACINKLGNKIEDNRRQIWQKIEEVKKNREIEILSKKLEYCLKSVTYCVLSQSKKRAKGLFLEAKKLAKYILDDTSDEDSNFDAFMAIFRMLQGIIGFHQIANSKYIYSEAMSLCQKEITDRQNATADYSAIISWSAIYNDKNKDQNENQLTKKLQQFLGAAKPYSILHDMLSLVEISSDDEAEQEPSSDALSVFQNSRPARIIDNICNKSHIPHSHICAVARLASVFRPQAMHESDPLEIAFVVGTPYHRESLFNVEKNIYTNSNSFKLQPPKLDRLRLEWLPINRTEAKNIVSTQEWYPEEIKIWYDFIEKPKKTKEEMLPEYTDELSETYLNLCTARIKGRAGEFSGPQRLLFIDYTQKCPAISHVVTIKKTPWNSGEISLRELTEDKTQYGVDTRDMVIIRVVGRKRIELLYSGSILLSWDDGLAQWCQPPQWDTPSLLEMFEKKLSGIFSHYEEHLKLLAEIIIEISDAPREGTSIVLSENKFPPENAGHMTEPEIDEKNNYNISILTQRNAFRNLATQDGGVIVDFSKKEVKYRQAFKPFHKDKSNRELVPFDLMDFKIKVGTKSMKLSEAWRTHKNYRWKEWPSVLHWGTRHLNSLGLTACLEKLLCICISEDGPIHVFEKGIALNPEVYKTNNDEKLVKG